MPKRSPAAKSGDAIRVSAKDGESDAEILKAIKVKVNGSGGPLHPKNQEEGDPSGPEKGW